jgi:hypothetical protein
MRKRIFAVVLAVGALGMLPATVAQARTSKTKGPLCVQHTAGKLHVQVGYCPGR